LAQVYCHPLSVKLCSYGHTLATMSALLAFQALGVGLLSALSMPIGAVVGIIFAPVPEKLTAHFMAFGAGALVYAVSTELFGEALFTLKFHRASNGSEEYKPCDHTCLDKFNELLAESAAAIAGAICYILLERYLKSLSHDKGGDSSSSARDGGGTEMRPLVVTELEPSDEVEDSSNAAFAMWLGLLLDGIPESLMLGFMTKEGDLGFVLLFSIFVANFPEAFSSAAILKKQGAAISKIMCMWLSIFFITGILTMIGFLILPEKVEVGSNAHLVKTMASAVAEGFTGGSMFAMIATAMLPEAFKHAGTKSGLSFVVGFVLSVMIADFGVRFHGTQEFEP